jgi:hypothetical protein
VKKPEGFTPDLFSGEIKNDLWKEKFLYHLTKKLMR